MVAARRPAAEPRVVRQQSRKFSWGRKSRCVWLAVFTRAALRSSVSSASRDLPRCRRLLHGAAAPSVGHLRRRRPKRVAARGAPLWLYSVCRLERTHRGFCLQAAPPEPDVASLVRIACRPSRVCSGAALGSRPVRIVRAGERGCLQAWRFGRPSALRCGSVRVRRRRPALGSRAAGFAINVVLTREHPAGGRRSCTRRRRRS
jgi:hypothetical protein